MVNNFDAMQIDVCFGLKNNLEFGHDSNDCPRVAPGENEHHETEGEDLVLDWGDLTAFAKGSKELLKDYDGS